MAKNTSYELAELWVLKDGKDAKSTNRDDWTIYGNPSDLKFTNSESSAGQNTVYIKDGSVIRLVADTTTDLYNNAATFYDYDITDDGKTTWDGTNGSHGINSSSNYTGSGAKLAFGNANTGTGLFNESWNCLTRAGTATRSTSTTTPATGTSAAPLVLSRDWQATGPSSMPATSMHPTSSTTETPTARRRITIGRLTSTALVTPIRSPQSKVPA